jgi:hypothetical protein
MRWEQWGLVDVVPLDIVSSPYREITRPLIAYLHKLDDESSYDLPTTVVLPQFVVTTWWENLLHNQTSRVIRAALHADQIANGRGRPVIDVPYRIGEELYEPITTPLVNGETQPAGQGGA